MYPRPSLRVVVNLLLCMIFDSSGRFANALAQGVIDLATDRALARVNGIVSHPLPVQYDMFSPCVRSLAATPVKYLSCCQRHASATETKQHQEGVTITTMFVFCPSAASSRVTFFSIIARASSKDSCELGEWDIWSPTRLATLELLRSLSL